MGSKSKRQTVGYKYFLGAHMLLCGGVVDSIRKIFVGERLAYSSPVTAPPDVPLVKYDQYIKDPVEIGINFNSIDWETIKFNLAYLFANRNISMNPRTTWVRELGFIRQLVVVGSTATFWVTSVDAATGYPESPIKPVGAPNVGPGNTFAFAIKVQVTASGSNIIVEALRAVLLQIGASASNLEEGITIPIAMDEADTSGEVQVAIVGAFGNLTEYIKVGLAGLEFSGQTTPSVYVDAPNLFGGEKKEGGVQGVVDYMFGNPSQTKNKYLSKFQGEISPAYRGVTSLVFRKFYWSAMNPYFKPVWVEVSRITNGWARGSCWNPEDSAIPSLFEEGYYDMNPIHIIYECLTDTSWGMGYDPSDIDELSFTEAARRVNMGLSLTWSQQTSIEDFIRTILDHISAVLMVRRQNGKFAIRLLRDPFADGWPYILTDGVGGRYTLDRTNIIEFKSYQRAVVAETANEVVVKYRDRLENEKSIAVQNLASIRAQGGVVSTTKEYPGIRTYYTALSVAERDLLLLSTPLAKIELVVDRTAYELSKGDSIEVDWPDLNISDFFRVVDINYGSLTEGRIELQLVEDVFKQYGYTNFEPNFGYDDATFNGGAANPFNLAAPPVESQRAIEAPYWLVIQTNSRAEVDYLEPEYGFGVTLVTRGADKGAVLNYDIWASATNATADFKKLSSGNFNSSGKLLLGIGKTTTTISLTEYYDLDVVETDEDDGFAYINDEIVGIVSIDIETGTVVIRRGCLDTVPASHSAGSRVYFETGDSGFDPTERVAGETTYYRATSNTSTGSYPVGSALTSTLLFKNRASRPYPPARFKINGQDYPTSVSATSLDVTWVHRNRLSQTVRLVDQTEGSITPEPNTTYNLRIYSGASSTILQEYLDIVGESQSWTPDTPNTRSIRVELESVLTYTSTVVVDNVEVTTVTKVTSLYKHSHSMTFTNT